MSMLNWVYLANADLLAGKSDGEPMVAFNLNSVAWSVQSSAFSENELKDPPGLIAKLKIGKDEWDRHLWKQVTEQLSESEKTLLEKASATADEIRPVLLKALNSDKVLGYPSFYKEEKRESPFEFLRAAGKLRKGPEGHDPRSTTLRNRLLLEDAYPGEIERMRPVLAESGSKEMFPWRTNGNDHPVLGDFVLYTHTEDIPTKDWATKDVDVSKSKANRNSDLAGLLEKAYSKLWRLFPVDRDGKRDTSALLTYVDPGPHAAPAPVLDNTWSSILVGASMQGYPVAHSLSMAFWLTAPGLSQLKWILVVPKTLNGLALTSFEPANRDWWSRQDLWPVNVTYGSVSEVQSVLRVNAIRRDTAALSQPFIGSSQLIHAGTFTNWMGTLPQKLGEYLDLIWILNDTQPSSQELKTMAAFFAARLPAYREILEQTMGDATVLPLAPPVVGTISGARSWLDNATFVSVLKPFLKRWVEPALLLFHDHADLGLRRPFHIARDEPIASSQTLAGELIEQAVIGAAKPVGETGEDFEAAWKDLTEHLINNAVYTFKKKSDPLNSPVMNWTRDILLPVLQQIDGDGFGNSRSGHYQELLEVALFEVGAVFGVFRDLETNDLSGDELANAFVSTLGRAQEQLSSLMDDEEALLRIFCLQWDAVLNNLRSENKDLYNRIIAHLGHADLEKGNDEPQIIMNAGPRERIREYLQQANIRLSGRYADALTGDVLPDLAGLLDSDFAPLIQGLASQFSFEKRIPPPIGRPTIILPAEVSDQQWSTIWGSALEHFPQDVSPLHEWSKTIDLEKDGTRYAGFAKTEDIESYVAFLIRCFVLLSRSDSVDKALDCVLSGGDTTLDANCPSSNDERKKAIRSQLFLAAAYLGRGLFSYIGQRRSGSPKLRDGEPEIPGAMKYYAGNTVPTGEDAASIFGALARVLCDPLPVPKDREKHGQDGAGKSVELYWKKRPWTQVLIGLDRVRSFMPTPPPLPVPLLVNRRDYDPTRCSGVLIFARRVDEATLDNKSGWWLVNVGQPIIETKNTLWPKQVALNAPFFDSKQSGELTDALADEVSMDWLNKQPDRFIPFTDAKVGPAPWQVVESYGITQSVVEFRGKPLGLRCWDDAEDDPASNKEVTGSDRPVTANSEFDLVRYQIVSSDSIYKKWGPVPGLRYDKKWRYEFLFAPIHNTGALPWQLKEEESGGLSSKSEIFRSLTPKDIEDHKVTITDYLRRVPIGQVRLGRPMTKEKNYYEGYEKPILPEGVRPLYDDLQDQMTYEYLKKFRPLDRSKLDIGYAPPSLPAQTLLLRPSAKGEDALESIARFLIRPPATAIENWTIWQSSQLDNEADSVKKANAVDCIADINRLARELSQSATPAADKARGLELTQLLDDPAVKAVVLRVKLLLDLREATHSERGARNNYVFETVLSFPTRQIRDYKGGSDPPIVGGDQLPDKVRQNCREMVQVHTERVEEIWIKWAPAEFDVSKAISVSDRKLTITVPAGCISELELTPCLRGADKERFGIYDETKGELKKVAVLDDCFEVCQSTYRIWAEAVPSLEGLPKERQLTNKAEAGLASAQAPSYLPNSAEVWKALRLAEVGTYGREARRVQRLEVAVLPRRASDQNANAVTSDLDLMRKWCFVSEVRAEIQPWVWRGLPEDKYDKLAELIKPQEMARDDNGLWERDEDRLILRKLVEGEAAAFGEREDATASVQKGLVNYAAPFKLRWDGVDTPMPPFIIYQDQGEQDEVPRYFRVKLVIKSRYAGLGSSTQKDLLSHDTPVASEFAWDWPLQKDDKIDSREDFPKRKSSYRRILFRGHLRSALDLPRVKMVIPLLEALPDEESESSSGSKATRQRRPGFIVLTREPLRSPWHRLIGEVDWARVNLGGPSDREVIKEIAEFGPDPLTAQRSFDWAFKSKTDLKARSELDGRAFGLTYEREADAPFFPNAGFYFDPPFQPKDKESVEDVTMNDFSNDWFAKVRFRWEVRPSYVMDNLAKTLVGKSTQSWQVRLLAPFQWVRFAKLHRELEETIPYDLQKVTFQYVNEEPVFSGYDEKGNWGRLGPPRGPEYGRNTEHPDASPAGLLLFVAWSLVPDFLNAERSKIAHSIFAFHRRNTLPMYRNPSLQGDKTRRPDGGNFMLLFGRQGDLEDFVKTLPNPKTTPTKPGEQEDGLDVLINKFLFPRTAKTGKTEQIDPDARAMITRCSPPIFIS